MKKSAPTNGLLTRAIALLAETGKELTSLVASQEGTGLSAATRKRLRVLARRALALVADGKDQP